MFPPHPSPLTRQLNGTCVGSVDLELFLHYSLIPSLFIILILSFLQRREHRKQREDTSHLLGNRFEIIIPLDFVGTFSNRWSYGIAFGATANKVMFLFSEGYQPLQIPQWAQGKGCRIPAGNFAVASLAFREHVLGFSGIVINVMSHQFETVLFYWPSLLCLAFLLGRFLHMFVKSLRVHLGWELQTVSLHNSQETKKSWFQTRIYEWDPCFQFPSRMIGTTVLAFICLYLFIVIEFCMFVYVRDELDVFEGELESYIASVNQTGTLTPVSLQVKELMSVSEVWLVTILPASLTCVSYLFHILACYRKHMKRLWAGKKHFLPLKFHNPSSAESVVAIARYSGWQIAYMLWGYLIIHVVQSLCGMLIMYSLVLPVLHNQGLEMLQGLGIGTLTIAIVLGLMVLQVWIAATFFLQPKMSAADRQKPLALNNRKAFHNFNYFLFFYNVLLGLGACLSRLLISCVLGTWLIARIDRTIMQNGYEGADMGFSAWIGMLYVDHYHTNPVLVSFCNILITGHRERKLQRAIKYWCLNQSTGPRISARSRTRWFLLQTLVNNPRLVMLRKARPGHGSRDFTQILLTCSES
uniref:Stimulated by retinoic acid gene 6 protein-like n=1 Tax=Neovison vison TaxID=452646 RepID=A0A8C7BKH9_NEOVI